MPTAMGARRTGSTALTPAELGSLTGFQRERIDDAVRGLADDGIVRSRRGRIRLAE